MKIRHINYFERHAEKITLGVTALILGVAVYHYWMGTPNTVTISGQTVTPEEVDQVILRQAERLQAELDGETPEELAQITVPPYRADFVGRRSRQLLSEPRLAGPIGPMPLFEGEDPVPGTRHPFHVPQVPAVPVAAARAEIGTLESRELDHYPDLMQYMQDRDADESPDVAWVSLVGQFDVLGLVQELSHYEEGASRRIPERWWINSLAIVDVEVERQRQLPDGSWSDPQPVRELPGTIERPQVTAAMDPADAEEIIDIMHEQQLDLIRRPFFELVNREWQAPDPDEAEDEFELERIAELREEIENEERRLDRMMDTLDRLRRQNRNRGGGGRRGGGFEDGGMLDEDGGGRRGGRGGGRRPQQNTEVDRAERQAERIADNLYELQVEYHELTNQPPPDRPRVRTGRGFGEEDMFDEEMMLDEPDFEDDYFEEEFGFRDRPGRGRPRGRRSVHRGPPEDADLDEELGRFRRSYFGAIPLEYVDDRHLDIWAHDLFVEEGETYRYRMRVAVTNPLFNRDTSLPDEQREQYNQQFLLHSDWSDWSQPQHVEPMQHFFFVDASRSDVTAEVWRFTRGEWFQHEFTVAPGDPIGQETRVEGERGRTTVDFFTNAYVVDVDFEHPLPGEGTISRTSPRVLYAVERPEQPGQVNSRIVESDRGELKRQWLQLQQELAPLTMR